MYSQQFAILTQVTNMIGWCRLVYLIWYVETKMLCRAMGVDMGQDW